jgi:hypothetical protein
MSGLLLRMVLSVCTCWFHGMVTLPPQLVSTLLLLLLLLLVFWPNFQNIMTCQDIAQKMWFARV